MRRVIWLAGVLLGWGVAAEGARADFITYSFTGTDTRTGASVFGQFGYQTTAPASTVTPSEVAFANVQGFLTITEGNHTDASGVVSGALRHESLELTGSDPATGRTIGIILASANSSAVFKSLSSLPATLNPSALSGSSFLLFQGPPNPIRLIPGGTSGTGDAVVLLGGGPITVLDPVTITLNDPSPEPSGLILAALGGTALFAARRARR
jgi:hypothetical protein